MFQSVLILFQKLTPRNVDVSDEKARFVLLSMLIIGPDVCGIEGRDGH